MSTPTPQGHEFNFTFDQIGGVELHSIVTLVEQLDEMGYDTSALHTPENGGGLRIELELKSEHPDSIEDAIVRIHGTLLRHRPEEQTLRYVL